MKNTIAYLKKIKRDLPKVLGNEAVNFFQDNIKQGIDSNGVAFKKRAGNLTSNEGRTVLTQRGTLRRSLRVVVSPNLATIVSSVPYANIHNQGGQIQITPKMRKFFWAMHHKANGKAEAFADSTQDSKIRRWSKINKEAQFWRNLALKQTPIQMTKRQFAGGGARLQKRLAQAVTDMQ